MRDKILGLVGDLVADFLYYDCKNNEEREHGDIAKAVADGEITIDEMVEKFKEKLVKHCK